MSFNPSSKRQFTFNKGDLTGVKTYVLDTGNSHITFLMITNPNDTPSYLQLFDKKSSDVTVGTTVPLLWLPIPKQGGLALDKNFGLDFNTGITIAFTTTATGNVSPANAGEICIIGDTV